LFAFYFSSLQRGCPFVSREAGEIVFAAKRKPFNIWTADADGGNLSQVTIEGGRFPSWYPDGKQIAFLSDRQGLRKFWSIASVGGDEKSLFALDAPKCRGCHQTPGSARVF